MGTGSARGAVAGLARDVRGGNRRRRGEGENRDQATMNTNSEVKKARDQRGSIGARRLRFTARTVLGVPESQAWWTLKRPDRRRAEAALWRAAEAEGRAPSRFTIQAKSNSPGTAQGKNQIPVSN
jgi:hypothetical protein